MRTVVFVLGTFIAVNSYGYENVFYCTYQNLTCVEASAAQSVSKSEIAVLIERVVAGQENFIGFVDPDGTTIQFFIDGVDDILVEIPSPAEKGSYGKKIDTSQMQSIVESLEFPYLNYIESLNLVLSLW